MKGNFLHLLRCDDLFNITVFLHVMPCSLVEQHCFTEIFAPNRAEDKGSRLICNGATLPECTVLQLIRQLCSFTFFKQKSLRSQMTVCTMTTSSFFIAWNCTFSLLPVNKYIILNGNPPPIVHTTVCDVSN
jgi:hypothetical protein